MKETFVEGQYYYKKGYYWKGKFIKSNHGQEAYELGYFHGLQIIKNVDKRVLREIKKMIKRITPSNDYERGKIDAIRNSKD